MSKEEITKRSKEFCEKIKNKYLKRIYDNDYRERNRDKIQLCKKNYLQNKKEELYKNIKKIKAEDSFFRLAFNLRKRVINAFKAQNVRKTNQTFYLLGCSHSFLRLWIESQLYGEMNLENYGKI